MSIRFDLIEFRTLRLSDMKTIAPVGAPLAVIQGDSDEKEPVPTTPQPAPPETVPIPPETEPIVPDKRTPPPETVPLPPEIEPTRPEPATPEVTPGPSELPDTPAPEPAEVPDEVPFPPSIEPEAPPEIEQALADELPQSRDGARKTLRHPDARGRLPPDAILR